MAEWNKGIPRTTETKVKISAKLKGVEKTKEHCENMKTNHVGTTGYHHSEKSKIKISIGEKLAYKEGRKQVITRGGWGLWTWYKEIHFRSQWEAMMAKHLDSKNIKWFYESERFALSNGSYLPDFLLPERNTVIEVKGRYVAIEPLELFKKEYTYKVIFADKSYFKRHDIFRYERDIINGVLTNENV